MCEEIKRTTFIKVKRKLNNQGNWKGEYFISKETVIIPNSMLERAIMETFKIEEVGNVMRITIGEDYWLVKGD